MKPFLILLFSFLFCIPLSKSNPLDSISHHKAHQWYLPKDYDQYKQYISVTGNHPQTTIQVRNISLRNNILLLSGILLMLLIWALLIRFSFDKLINIFRLTRVGSELVTFSTKPESTFSFIHLIFDILFISAFSLLIYFFLYPEYLYIEIWVRVLGLILLQLLVIRIAYYIFFGDRLKNMHLFSLLYSHRTIGIFLVPLLFFIFYLPENLGLIVAKAGLIFIALILIYRFFVLLNQLKKQYAFNFLYILLYLCVFEISLILIIIKEFSWIFKTG